VRQLVESITPAIKADGGDLYLARLTDGVATLTYRQPADCEDGVCSMPPERVKDMIEAMFRAQGETNLTVSVEVLSEG